MSFSGASKEQEETKSRFSGIFSFLNECCPTLPTLNSEDQNMKLILDRLDMIEQNVRDLSTVGSSVMASPSIRTPSPYIVGEVKESSLTFNEMTGMMMGTGTKGESNPVWL